MKSQKKIIRIVMLAAILVSFSLMKSTVASLDPGMPILVLIFAGLLNVCRFSSILGLLADQKIGTIAFIIVDSIIILMSLFLGGVNIGVALIDLLLVILLIINNNSKVKVTNT